MSERRPDPDDPRFPQPKRPPLVLHAEPGTAEHDELRDRPGREPSVLDVTEGGSAGFTCVRWDGTRLLRHVHGEGADRIEPLTATTPEQWDAFWRAVDRLGVWSWKTRYLGQATDSYFAVEIEHNGRRIASDGQDSGYPDNYDEFRRAVAELTGEEER